MLLTFADREQMIRTLANGKVESLVELGVYKGAFAEFCARTLTPRKHVLVDFWDYERYEFVLDEAPQNLQRNRVFSAYFENDPVRALRDAYVHVTKTFAQNASVEIVKDDIGACADRFADGSFEVIYLDGNHSHEFVLRDLYKWFPKLAAGGLFICNDFYESEVAAKQNIGVISAFCTFSKRFQVHPIALSMCEWSDFYFSNAADSPLIQRLLAGLASAGYHSLEVPCTFLGAYHHRLMKNARGSYLMPSFTAA